MSGAKNILVACASSGAGRSTALALARRGHTVYAALPMLDGPYTAAAAVLQQATQAEPWALHPLAMDVTCTASVQAAVAAIVDSAGVIDVVVHYTDSALIGITETVTVEQAQELFNADLFGALRVNQAVLPHMRRQGSGLLVYLSCTAGSLVYPFMGVYNAAKAALESMAQTLHYELYSLGIDTAVIQACAFASNVEARIHVAHGPAQAEAYGPVGAVAERFVRRFPVDILPAEVDIFHDVAELVAELMETPLGQRPFKAAIGAYTDPLQFVHQAVAAVQSQVLPRIGLSDLGERPPPRRTDA